jgi:ribosomal protein S27AE
MKSVYDLLNHIVSIIPCNDSTSHELDKKLDLCKKELLQSSDEAMDELLAKCNDCGSRNLRASGDDLVCNRCGDNQTCPRCSQVVLRIKNTDRTDILCALRVWEKQLNPQSKMSAQKLIDYIDNAGYED